LNTTYLDGLWISTQYLDKDGSFNYQFGSTKEISSFVSKLANDGVEFGLTLIPAMQYDDSRDKN
jgi:hypothetical protein